MSDYKIKQSLIEEKNAISSSRPWLFAIHLHTAIDLEGYDKIVANTEDFVWKDDNDNEMKFSIFPFTISGIAFTSSGKFPQVTLNIFNTAFIVKKMEQNNCFLGTPVTLYIINERACAEYTTDTYPIQFNFVVTDAKIGKYISLTLGTPNYLTRNVPARRYYRDFCPFEYRQEFCWMKNHDPEVGDESCDKSWSECLRLCKKYIPDTYKELGVPYGGFPNLAKGTVHYY